MEARLAALEARLAKEYEERSAKLARDQEERLAGLEQRLVAALDTHQAGAVVKSDQTYQLMEKFVPILENSVNLSKTLDEMKSKLDMLLGGENEANKLIDSIVPNVEKTKSDMKKMEKEIFHRMDKIHDEVKKIRDDQKLDQTTFKDVLHHIKRTRDEQGDRFKRIECKLDEAKFASASKRERSRSESSEHGSRARHASRSSRSRSRKGGRGNSRETSIASNLNRSRTEQEIEKKLSKVEENVGTINVTVAELKKDFSQRKVIDDQMLGNIVKVVELLQSQSSVEASIKIPAYHSQGEDDDRSPSPLNMSRMGRSPLKLPKTPKENKAKKKKKARSVSSSSSSSEERSSVRNQKKNEKLDMKSMEVIVATVSSIEERFKETIKNLKKSNAKIEENSKNTLDRVGEMTVGVQVIAENLDSVNDVARKVDILETVGANIVKLEGLEKLEGLDRLWEEVSSLRTLIVRQQQQQPAPPPPPPQLYSPAPPRLPPPISMGQDDGDWEDGPLRPAAPPLGTNNVEEMSRIVTMSMEERFCGVTGLIEDLSDRLSRKIDAVSSSKHDEDVPDIRVRLKRLEEGQTMIKSERPSSPGGITPPSQGMTDYRASQLERKISDISPKLDDLYIRVLPVMNEIKSTLRKSEFKEERIIAQIENCKSSVEKFNDKIEDIVEEKKNDRGLSSLDRRINNQIENEGVTNRLITIERNVQECVNALVEMRTFSAKQSSVDKIEKLLSQQREDLTFGSTPEAGSGDATATNENISRVMRRVETLLEFAKKQEKSMAAFMKNADSDAKTLSQCNTAIQGMKSAVTANGRDVLLAINSLGEQMRPMEVTMAEMKADMSGLGGSLDEIGGQVRNIDRDTAWDGEESVAKLQSGVDKITSIVRSLEKSGKTTSRKSLAADDTTLNLNDAIGSDDVKNQLEEINNNTTKFKEDLTHAVSSLKVEIKKTDTNVGKAIKNLLNLLNTTVELQKEGNASIQSLSKLDQSNSSAVENILGDIKDQIANQFEDFKSSGGGGPTDSAKIENRLNKLHQIVMRVKHLLEEDGSDDEDGSNSRKKKRSSNDGDMADVERLLVDVGTKLTDFNNVLNRLECMDDKIDKITRGSSDKKIEDLSFKLSEMEEAISRRIEDDLSSNVEKVDRMTEQVQEVKNIVHEVGDRMITTKTFNNSQTDLRKQINNLQTSISSVPDEFNQIAAAMEENLCINVETNVKEVFKIHWEELMNEIEQILGKLSTIKRIVKVRSREGSVEGEESEQPSLESVVAKINEVADKLAGVQNVMESRMLGVKTEDGGSGPGEHLGTALLLEEIRKKVDVGAITGLKKDMFTAVHNVQSRLLEEQVRAGENKSLDL